MSPDNVQGTKPAAINDVYTALLALALVAVLSTTVFMVLKCMSEYGSVFRIAKP